MGRKQTVSFIFYLCIVYITVSLEINASQTHENVESQAIANSTAFSSAEISQNIDRVSHSSLVTSGNTNVEIKYSSTTPESADVVTKILKKSRRNGRKSFKERSRRQNILPGYDPLESSKHFDLCPQLAFSCPTCTETKLQVPQNFCSLNLIALKVLLISPPMTDANGRICGKFGLLIMHGNADIKDFRRLLRFSVQESCGCHLKASRQYYLISPLSAFLKEGLLFNKIILTDQTMLISVDRYIERDILQIFNECSTAGYQPYTTSPYASSSIDPQTVDPYPVPPLHPRTSNPSLNPPSGSPDVHPVSSIYSDKLSYSSPTLDTATSLYPSFQQNVAGTYDGNLPSPQEQNVSSHLQTPTGFHDVNAIPLHTSFTRCTVPSTCPECTRIETIPDITHHYCASSFAFVGVLRIPDRPPVTSTNYTSLCLNLPTNIVYDVSKNIDPRVVVNSLSAFLPLMCSECFENIKGPVIVLLISDVFPSPPATQFDGNFRLFIIPVPSTITLPNCDPYYPSLYSFRLDKVQEYASPECPDELEHTCPVCHFYSDSSLAAACEGGFGKHSRLAAVMSPVERNGSNRRQFFI
ncbi:uncharacterized protein NPIL_236961 [Nephila pilipes]|uniref:Uncharacterized protein n=1 Tax=Nephila pilipes TaxID=299642 RepID=A0A8X6T395_NEPPI|nr:uncharacterized protein NPIL_236961 [Nephila pilipes]